MFSISLMITLVSFRIGEEKLHQNTVLKVESQDKALKSSILVHLRMKAKRMLNQQPKMQKLPPSQQPKMLKKLMQSQLPKMTKKQPPSQPLKMPKRLKPNPQLKMLKNQLPSLLPKNHECNIFPEKIDVN